MIIFLSFNYVPPAPIAFTISYIIAAILFISLLFVRKPKTGALVGGAGSFVITWQLYAGDGDMNGWQQLIQSPINGLAGALLGACISFIGKSLMQNKQNNADKVREQLKNISFPDAEILCAFLDGQEVHVVIKDWREQKINLRFSEVALFKSFGFGGHIFSHLILTESKEIDEAIEVIKQDYGSVSEDHGFVHLSFSDDAPLLVVVFSSLQVEIENL